MFRNYTIGLHGLFIYLVHWKIHPTHTHYVHAMHARLCVHTIDATIHTTNYMCAIDTHKRYDATYDVCVRLHALFIYIVHR